MIDYTSNLVATGFQSLDSVRKQVKQNFYQTFATEKDVLAELSTILSRAIEDKREYYQQNSTIFTRAALRLIDFQYAASNGETSKAIEKAQKLKNKIDKVLLRKISPEDEDVINSIHKEIILQEQSKVQKELGKELIYKEELFYIFKKAVYVFREDVGEGSLKKISRMVNIITGKSLVKVEEAPQRQDIGIRESIYNTLSYLQELKFYQKNPKASHICRSYGVKNYASLNGTVQQMLVNGYYQGDLDCDLFLKQMPLEKRLEALIQISKGVKYLHDRDIVHRDIKPSNMLYNLTEENGLNVVVSDFNLMIAPQISYWTSWHAKLFPAGTNFYVAPEIFDAVEAEVNIIAKAELCARAQTKASDIYSLGVSFTQILFNKKFLKNLSEDEKKQYAPYYFYSFELIKEMMNIHNHKRPTIDTVINKLSEFFNSFVNNSLTCFSINFDQLIEDIKAFLDEKHISEKYI